MIDPGAYAGVAFDIDGVLARGEDPVPGAAGAVLRLRAAGTGVAFVTNNATRTPDQVAGLLRAVGVDASVSEVVTSPVVAAAMLAPGTRVLVIGMEGLRVPLADRGCVEVVDPAEADAVVVGLDRDLTYDALRRATLALRAGARFVATNRDATFPAADGLWPGAGAIVAALVTAGDREPEVAGKPHAPMFRAAAAALPGGRLLMVGDRVDTDIAGAAALGWDTALVLTGVTTPSAAAATTPPPTYVADSAGTLIA